MSLNEREYHPRPSILPFHDSHAQVKALCGPAGCGKTIACGFEVFFTATEASVPLRALVVRESYRQLHDSTRRTLQEWFGGCSSYHKGDEQLRITIPNVDGDVLTHELDFRHCRRPEEVSNLLSTEYGVMWLEEPVPAYQVEGGVIGAGLPQELFDMALMRLRQGGLHRTNILLSFNPPSKFHWIYDEFFRPSADELRERDYALFRCKPYENAKHLPPNYYQSMLSRLGEDLARRFVLGEVVTIYPGRRVYTEAYEQIHFVENLQPTPGLPLVIAFDFGLTPVAVIGQTLPSGRLLILSELQLWSSGIARLAEELKELLKRDFPGFTRWRCWGDPAGAQRAQTDERTCFQLLAAEGFAVNPGAVDFTARFEAVSKRFGRFIDGQPAVLIDRSHCPVLMESLLGGYRYGKSWDHQKDPAPMKNKFSHSANAFEYLCSGEFSAVSGEATQTSVDTRRLPPFNPLQRAPRRQRTSWMAR